MTRMRLGFMSLLTVFLSIGCDAADLFTMDGANHMKAGQVRELIATELQIGSSAAEIERLFESNDMTYTYDRFANRYQAIIRDVSTSPKIDQAIVIHVNVDGQRRFLSAEVNDSFTGP